MKSSKTCLLICSFDPFISWLLTKAELRLRELSSSSQTQEFQCLHLGPPLKEFQCIYLNTRTAFGPSLFHRVEIQISCQVFENAFLPRLDHC